MWPIFIFWEMGLPYIALNLALCIIGLDFLFRFWRKKITYFKIHDFTKGHAWCYIATFDNVTYCSICEMLLTAGGMLCDCCGICINSECKKKADRRLKCKQVSCDSLSMKHHWIKGNLPPGSICHVCDQECGAGNGLSDYRCCWCQWTVHKDCLANLGDLCNLGAFRNFIIPPTCIAVKRSQRVKLQSKCIISSIRVPPWGPSWRPLIVIGNGKSGSSEACHILSSARKVLNAVQAIDLANQEPKVALQLCNLLKGTQCRLLIAGGDGTIAWVLNAVQNLKTEKLPETAVVPMGTGNDLARVLGWGSHIEGELEFNIILKKIGASSARPLDRFNHRKHVISMLQSTISFYPGG